MRKEQLTIASTKATVEDPDLRFVSEVIDKTLDSVLLADELTARRLEDSFQ